MSLRLVGDRFGLVRLLILPAAVGDVLILDAPGRQPPVALWLFALGSAVLSLAGGFVPLTVALGQAAIFAGSGWLLHQPPVTTLVMASVALVELTVRRWGWPTLAGAGALAAVFGPAIPHMGLVNAGYSMAWMVVVPVLVGAYLRSVWQNMHQARERATQAERNRELSTVAARLAERTAVARELHDIVAHHVASIALRVAVARHVLPRTDPRVAEVLDDVHTAATTALADLRHLVGVLRDPNAVHADLGSLLVQPEELPAALAAVVDRNTQSGLAVDAAIDPAVAGLDAVSGLVVLRLVQEGLTNVAKHAGPAAKARLRVDLGADRTARVEISDDGGGGGGGGAPARAATEPGHGLAGLRERLALVGGRLDAGPADLGWRLAAEVPAR
jgi:signal transduction histidine kinase